MTIAFTEGELERLEKKYDCDRETLNLAIELADRYHIEFELHDDVEDAATDVKGTQV